jgi:hypothetical protein
VPFLISTSAEIAPPLVTQLAVVLVGAALVGYVCQRIGLIPIVGYLATGALLGPYALGVVESTELVDQLAEVGVIVRTSQRLDVDNVRITDEDLTLIVDEEVGDAALARAITRVMAGPTGS